MKLKSFNSWSNLLVLHQDEYTIENYNKLTQEFPVQNKQIMIETLKKLKIVPFGSHFLKSIDQGISDNRNYWDGVHDSYKNRNEMIRNEVEKLFKLFNKNNICSICLFENFGTLLLTNECLGCFSSGDIDLNANGSEAEQIHAVLLELGYVQKLRRGVSEDIMSSYYINGVIPEEKFWVNIEWKPIARSYVHTMKKLEARLNQFRESENSVLDNGIRVLNPTAMMYFNLLHISVGHYYSASPGIRLYVDVDRLARSCDIDWNLLLGWAIEDKQEIRIITASTLCKYLLNTPIPEINSEPYIESRSKRIINYLHDRNSDNLSSKESLISQIFIDILSEDVQTIKYLFFRIINSNKN